MGSQDFRIFVVAISMSDKSRDRLHKCERLIWPHVNETFIGVVFWTDGGPCFVIIC